MNRCLRLPFSLYSSGSDGQASIARSANSLPLSSVMLFWSCPALGGCFGERCHYFGPVHRAIRFQPNTLTRKLIDYGQDADCAAIGKLLADEIG